VRPMSRRSPARRAVAACVAVALAAGCGARKKEKLPWGMGVATFDAVALGLARARTPDRFVDGIRAGRIAIPTYDGSGQATHPDVIVERDAAGAVRVVMAMTPYPFSADRLENPSVVVSTDGMHFAPPAGLANPLAPAPPTDHNNDPDLRRDPRTGAYELLYLEAQRPAQQTLVALTSADLVTWTRRDAIVYDLAHGAPFIVSPAAIDDGGKTYLFFVETEGRALKLLTSDDGRTWDVARAAPVDLALGKVTPWHVDVVRGDGAYALLISGYEADFSHQSLYLATSPDLAHWTLRPAPLLAYTDPALGVESMYRSTGVVDHGTLIVWYSMQYRP
jgi:hypothetical protein